MQTIKRKTENRKAKLKAGFLILGVKKDGKRNIYRYTVKWQMTRAVLKEAITYDSMKRSMRKCRLKR